jgi:signal transduction histidine kinase
VERECVVSILTRKGESREVALSVRASPFELKGERFTVFCMTDIGTQKLFQELEHSFLHDISNVAMALCAGSESLRRELSEESQSLADDICDLTQRLSREITVQRLLISSDPSRHRLNWQTIELGGMLRFAQRLAATHPCAQLKRLAVESPSQVKELTTDPALLERVLTNMLINAFEATSAGGCVRLRIDSSKASVMFGVQNAGCIPPLVASRIFRRHFTTKRGLGRGQGTYAMRLLGETLLQGRVGFSSGLDLGTEFYVELPITPDRNRRSILPKR